MWKDEIKYKDLRHQEKLDKLSARWGVRILDKSRFERHIDLIETIVFTFGIILFVLLNILISQLVHYFV